jgi:hypothetical protein
VILEVGQCGESAFGPVSQGELASSAPNPRTGRVYPREPGAKARLPVRHEFHCEAPAGVADPETTWPGELVASTQEGG